MEAQTTPVAPQAPLTDTAAAGGHPDTWAVERQIAHMEDAAHRQRLSGVRIKVVHTGCYYLYGADGRSLGTTTYPTPFFGYTEEELKATALRMAFSEELLVALEGMIRAFESTATLSISPSVNAAYITSLAALAKATGAA